MFEWQEVLRLAGLFVHIAFGFLQGYFGGVVMYSVTGLASVLFLRLATDRRSGRPRPYALRVLLESVLYSAAGGLGIALTVAPVALLPHLPFLPRHRYGFALWASALMLGLIFHQISLRRR